MEKNLIAISFADASKAYQSLAELKQAAAQTRVELESAAVVERSADGSFLAKDGVVDDAIGGKVLTGSLIGGLIGLLAGPLGLLLGGATGAAFGSLDTIDDAARRTSLLEQFMDCMPPGSTAVVAIVGEYADEVVDTLSASLGGQLLRRPVSAVQAEVDAQMEALESAAKEARRVLRERQRDEWRQKCEAWRLDASTKVQALAQRVRAGFEKHD